VQKSVGGHTRKGSPRAMTIISARPGARGRLSLGVFSSSASLAAATPVLGDVTNMAGSTTTPGFSESRPLKRRVSWAPEGTLGRASLGGERMMPRRLEELQQQSVHRVPVTPAASLARKMAVPPPRSVEEDPELPRRHRLASQARRLAGTGRLAKRRDVEVRLRETLQARIREAVEQTGAALKERSMSRRNAYFRELHEWQAAQAKALEAADERRQRELRELAKANERRRAEEARREAEVATMLAADDSAAWGAMLGDQDEVDDLKARLGFLGEPRPASRRSLPAAHAETLHMTSATKTMAPGGAHPASAPAPEHFAHLAPPAHALPMPSIVPDQRAVAGRVAGGEQEDDVCEVVKVRAGQVVKRGAGDKHGVVPRNVDMGTSPTIPKAPVAPTAKTHVDMGTSPLVMLPQGVGSPADDESDGDGLEVDLPGGDYDDGAFDDLRMADDGHGEGGDATTTPSEDEVELLEEKEFTVRVMQRKAAGEDDAPLAVTPQTPEVWYETVQVDEEVSFRLLSTGKKPAGAVGTSAQLTPGHPPLISFDDEDTVVCNSRELEVEDGHEATSDRPRLDPILEQLDTPKPEQYASGDAAGGWNADKGPSPSPSAAVETDDHQEEGFTVCENEEYAYEGGGGDEWDLPGPDEAEENDENADPGVPVPGVEGEVETMTAAEALKRKTPKPKRVRKEVAKTPNRKPPVRTKKRGPRLQHRKSMRGGVPMEIECISVDPNTPATGDTPGTGMPGGPPNEPGVAPRRGKRWRIRPLEFWNNERVVYTRAYDELPTLAEVQMHAHSDDDDNGVGASYKPGKRKRTGRKPDPDFPTPSR